MNRSISSAPRRLMLAFARALLTCVGVVAVLAVLAPSAARAATPYSLAWARTQAAGSCEIADLGKHDGEAFFHVNDTPLPTYQIPGALVTNADGSTSNLAEAGFDSVLLRTGANDFWFGASIDSGDDSCVLSHEVVHLISVPLGLDKLLFDVLRNGTSFSGTSQVDLSLAEINPQLAQDIAYLETALTAERKTLFANAATTADLAEKLGALQQLDAELHDLVTRPLDEITQEDLDAILDKYGDVVDEGTRAAVEQLLQDLQKSIDDLHDELASLIDEFGAQADAAADLVTGGASASGFDPDDPWGYSLGSSDVPPVAIPDVSGVPGAFDPGNDPYDAYADAVIAALADDVDNGEVVARADFVAQVRAWRANDKAIAKALAASMTISQAETSAFLKAETKVTAYVQQFMDAQEWFKDSTVPPDVRAAVDGVLKNKFGQLADQMKDALNDLDPNSGIDLENLFMTTLGFGAAMAAVDVATPYFEMMATLVQATERVAVGFVPFVGPTLDFCEAVTGRAWCMPDGEELSTEERIFSGAGVAVHGVATFWAGVKGAGIGAKGAAVAGIVANVDEDVAKGLHAQAIAKGLHANPRTWYKTLTGAITSKALDPLEVTAGRFLQNDGRALIGIGDDGVRRVLGIPFDGTGLPENAAKACDYLSVTKGNALALSEVKGVVEGQVNAAEALKQLGNTMKKVADKGLAGDVERVEIFIPKGASLKGDFAVLDGYLVRPSEGNKRVTLQGFKNLVMVVGL